MGFVCGTHERGEAGTGLRRPPPRPGVARSEEGEAAAPPVLAAMVDEGSGGLMLRSLPRETAMEMAGISAAAAADDLGVTIARAAALDDDGAGARGGRGDDGRDDGRGGGGGDGGGDDEEDEGCWFPMAAAACGCLLLGRTAALTLPRLLPFGLVGCPVFRVWIGMHGGGQSINWGLVGLAANASGGGASCHTNKSRVVLMMGIR